MIDCKRLVLGGGFAGCAVASLWGATILAPNLGGAARTKDFFPVMIYDDDESYVWRFVSELMGDYVLKQCQYAYHYDGDLHSSIGIDLSKRYYERSRGVTAPKELCGGTAKPFRYFEVDANDFFKTIEEVGVVVISGAVESIDLENKILVARTADSETVRVQFEELVSTIPAFEFFRLIGSEQVFEYTGKRFVSKEWAPICMGNYDYVYFPEGHPEDQALLRVTKSGGKFIHEYPHPRYFPAVPGVMSYAYIISPKSIPEIQGVKFFGRYAEWNDNISLCDVVVRAYRELR